MTAAAIRIDQYLDSLIAPDGGNPPPSVDDNETLWALDYSEWLRNAGLPTDDDESADFAAFWATAADIASERTQRSYEPTRAELRVEMVGGAK